MESGGTELTETYKLNEAKIEELYRYRDKYYLIKCDKIDKEKDEHAEQQERLNELRAQLDRLVADVESLDERECTKWQKQVLVGKALNVMPEYDQRAHDALTRAIKLEPNSCDAWNALAESYWKSKDFDMCRNCFERSISVRRTKEALRGMSIVMRQLMKIPSVSKKGKDSKSNNSQDTSKQAPSAETIRSLLDESIKYAKEAVEVDVADGMSWYILANSYVAKFFSPFGGGSSGLLKQASQAFTLALRDNKVAIWQSDLYYNKAMLSMYEEDWLDALKCLTCALDLDPYWPEVYESLCNLITYLVLVDNTISQKGKLKPKKLKALIDSIAEPTAAELGPYLSSSKTGEKLNLTQVKLNELEKGLNTGKVLVCKVISVVASENMLCSSYIITDSLGECSALTLYQLATGNGLIVGDCVAIPEPWCERVRVAFDLGARQWSSPCANSRRHALVGKLKAHLHESDCSTTTTATTTSGRPLIDDDDVVRVEFTSIRVENPTVLVVNGRKWTKDKLSSAFFVPKIIAD